MKPLDADHGRGFTLVELLLAIGISALIAVAAYAGIRVAMAADAGLRAEVQLLHDIQRAMDIITEDLGQMRPRNVRAGNGAVEAALAGGTYASPLLLFTRGGVGNPAALARSDLQRVRYVLKEGRLWRQQRNELDGADTNAAWDSVVLLDGVSATTLQFLARQQSAVDTYAFLHDQLFWEDSWDSEHLQAGQNNPLPVAVKVSMQIENFGQVQRVVELP